MKLYLCSNVFKPWLKDNLILKFNVFGLMGGEGEFQAFQNYLATNGLLHQVSCPYTPQQNGRVERKNRHVLEVGLSLLIQASMPLKYWSFAFQTAIFLINRLPYVVLSQNSSYGVLYNRLLDYTSLRSFGCLCFPYLRPYVSHKLANRSVVCYFLGYSAKNKGFLYLDVASSRIYASRHVVFDETQFSFLTKFLSSQPVSSSNSSSTLFDSSILSIPPPSSRNPHHPPLHFSSLLTVPIDSVP